MKQLIPHLSVLIALATLVGLAVHDTKVDTMTVFAVALPIAVASYEGSHAITMFGNDVHTHVERVSVAATIKGAMSSPAKISTRQNEDNRFRTPKNVVKGHHPFDNYSLPIAA